ncbi:MAG: hypothetical protein HFE97_07000, partial [Oscillospiraceae bacterium]|nr:hypothetical protein [Oscillospiraceae bacterium]
MRKHHIFTALFTALCLILTLLPPAGLAAGTAGTVIPAGNEKDGVRKAVEQAQSNDIIEISGTGSVNDTGGDAAPWVIDKAVTIRGATPDATLSLRAGGILLGADVTFENLKLSFGNGVRNVIMANGYTLALTNVTRDTSARKVHLLCGGLTNSSHAAAAPISGPHGRIVIRDCSGLGNVYAGSLSGDLPGTNSFDLPATVTITSGKPNSLEALYGCGALESPVGDNWFDFEEPAPPTPSTEYYPVNGPVVFEPYHTTVSRINGATGGSRDAAVSYTGGQYPNDALTVQNISSLSLAAGELIPAPGSSFHADTDLTVPKDTILGTVNLGAAPSVGSFTGGGTLVLGESQTLTIQDSVSGTTAVAVGSILQSGSSGTVIQPGSVLLKTSSAAQDAFRLIPYSTQPNMTLVLKETGDWVAQDPSVKDPILVETLKIQNVAAPTNQTEITIPYEEITFSAGSAEDSSLSYVPLTMLINSKDANRLEDQGSYTYTWNSVDASLLIEVYDDSLFLMEGNGGTIPAGTYSFSLSVPKANSASGTFFSVKFTLTVSDDAPTLRPITIPTAITGLTYTGQVQTGVAEGEGYTLTGHQATEVGTHTATAIL